MADYILTSEDMATMEQAARRFPGSVDRHLGHARRVRDLAAARGASAASGGSHERKRTAYFLRLT